MTWTNCPDLLTTTRVRRLRHVESRCQLKKEAADPMPSSANPAPSFDPSAQQQLNIANDRLPTVSSLPSLSDNFNDDNNPINNRTTQPQPSRNPPRPGHPCCQSSPNHHRPFVIVRRSPPLFSPIFILFSVILLLCHYCQVASSIRDEYFMNTPYGMCVPGLVFRVAAQAGEITTPGYPDEYPPKQDCRWLIDVTDFDRPDRVVVLKFVDFRTETLCDSERVEIYDGMSLDSPLLARICGNIDSYDDIKRYGGDGKRSWYNQTMVDLGFIGDDGWSYFASSSVMLVRFVTDQTWPYRGFRALFFAEDMPEFIREYVPPPTTTTQKPTTSTTTKKTTTTSTSTSTSTTSTKTSTTTTSTTAAPSTDNYDYGEDEQNKTLVVNETTTATTSSSTTTAPTSTDYYDYGDESTPEASTTTTIRPENRSLAENVTEQTMTTDYYDYGEASTVESSTTRSTTLETMSSTDYYDYFEASTTTESAKRTTTNTTPQRPMTVPACYGPSERLPPSAYNMRSTAFQFLVEPTISCDGVIDSVEFVSTQSSIDFILLVLRRYQSYAWLRSNESYWLLAYRNISTANYAIKPYTWTSINIADPISVNRGDLIGFMYHSIFVNHETAPLIPHAMTSNRSYAGYAELWDWNALTDFILHSDKSSNDSPLKRPLFDLHEVSSLNRPFRMPALRVRVSQSVSQPRPPGDDANYPVVFMEAPSDPQQLCSAMTLKQHTNSLSSATECSESSQLTNRIYYDPNAGQCTTTYDCKAASFLDETPQFFTSEQDCSTVCSSFVPTSQ